MKALRTLAFSTLLLLPGCLSSEGLFTTMGSTVGSTVGYATGGPAGALIGGTIGGLGTDAVYPEEEPLEVVPEEDRAEVLKHQHVWTAIETVGIWVVLGGIFAFFILPIITLYLPSPMSRNKH